MLETIAESNFILLSKCSKCIYNSIYAQLKAGTNSFMTATTTWALIVYKNMHGFVCHCRTRFSQCTVKENKGHYDPKTPQSVERRKCLTWFLKLSMKNSLLRINYNENVGKYSQKYSSSSKHLSLAKVKGRVRGFGLSTIIFTLPKLKQKELELNSTEILQLN